MKHEITDLDHAQCIRYAFDNQHQAQRVVITGVSGLGEDIKSSVSEALKDIKLDVGGPAPVMELPKFPDIIPVERIVVQEKVQIVEVPKIIYETKIVEVPHQMVVTKLEMMDRPVFVEKLVPVEVPTIIKEKEIVEIKNNDALLKIIIGVQSLATIGLLALNFFKH